MAILAVNSGSSSLKLGLYNDAGDTLLVAASVSGIGSDTAELKLTSPENDVLSQQTSGFAHVHDALDAAVKQMLGHVDQPVTAIGHRIVARRPAPDGGPAIDARGAAHPGAVRSFCAAAHSTGA